MHKHVIVMATGALLGIVVIGVIVGADDQKPDDVLAGWTSDFSAEKSDLVATGRNPHFILEPGYTLVLENGDARLVITVKDETKNIDGVKCRVVEEREIKGDQIVEVSNNYFAISKRTNNVYYFGEDAGGAWYSGKDGARFGLLMPGLPLIGGKYYQEIAPNVAMDRAEVVSVSEVFQTPAGEFTNCLKTEGTTPLNPAEKEYKHYAPGIGLIQDAGLRLVKYGKEKR